MRLFSSGQAAAEQRAFNQGLNAASDPRRRRLIERPPLQAVAKRANLFLQFTVCTGGQSVKGRETSTWVRALRRWVRKRNRKTLVQVFRTRRRGDGAANREALECVCRNLLQLLID